MARSSLRIVGLGGSLAAVSRSRAALHRQLECQEAAERIVEAAV